MIVIRIKGGWWLADLEVCGIIDSAAISKNVNRTTIFFFLEKPTIVK